MLDGLQTGDALLACSDGLWQHVNQDEMGEILSHHDTGEASKKLVTLARERGRPKGDNLSLALVALAPVQAQAGQVSPVSTVR